MYVKFKWKILLIKCQGKRSGRMVIFAAAFDNGVGADNGVGFASA